MLLADHGVMTLRHLFYLLISEHVVQNSEKDYHNLVRVIAQARRRGEISYSDIVDGTRGTIKPSSWTGLADFTETVREAYRKDLCATQRDCLELWVEKSAIVGVIEDVCEKYDVLIRPLRGYASLSMMHAAAYMLSQVEKPIFVYYLGDWDPSGLDIERSAHKTLDELMEARAVHWRRLAIVPVQIEEHRLVPIQAKTQDTRSNRFVREHGTRAVELDALPPDALRFEVEAAIISHVDRRKWKSLQAVEAAEKETFAEMLSKLT